MCRIFVLISIKLTAIRHNSAASEIASHCIDGKKAGGLFPVWIRFGCLIESD